MEKIKLKVVLEAEIELPMKIFLVHNTNGEGLSQSYMDSPVLAYWHIRDHGHLTKTSVILED